jgi:hypothetical protein
MHRNQIFKVEILQKIAKNKITDTTNMDDFI